MSKNIIAFAIIIAASIALSLPLAQSGLFSIHDDQQIARLFLFDQALKSGQFPVRWVDELGFGFGYPLFIFYPPLVYMVGEFFHILGFSFINSVKLTFSLSIFLSGVGIYLLIKEIYGKLPGIVSAIFYMLLPYRAVDLYVRGALAESFSFVWLPFIFWSLYKLAKSQKRIYILTSSVFLALLMITHNLIFLPFALLIPFFLTYLFIESSTKKVFLKNTLLAVSLSFALSAFFWLPALLEKKFTIVDDLLLVNLASYKIHFVYLQQLWNWPWGFGGSAEGLSDGISFKIGKLHVISAFAGFIIALFHILIRKNRKNIDLPKLKLSVVFFLLFSVSAFMTTNYSELIWKIISPLSYMQFPWRFLIFTGFFSSLLAGALIYLVRLSIFRLVLSVIFIALLLITNLKLFQPQSYRTSLNDETATSKEILNWDISQSSFEYIPKGVDLHIGELGTNLLNIKRNEIPTKKIEVISGSANIIQEDISPVKINFKVDSIQESKIRINTFNFPLWQLKVNEKQVLIDDNNKFKLITFNIPRGIHNISATFNNTRTRNISNAVSVISIILMLYLLARWKIQDNR